MATFQEWRLGNTDLTKVFLKISRRKPKKRKKYDKISTLIKIDLLSTINAGLLSEIKYFSLFTKVDVIISKKYGTASHIKDTLY